MVTSYAYVFLLCGTLCLLTFPQPSLSQPPPPPPNLSNSFSAKVKEMAVGGLEGEIYINHKLNKELQVIRLGSGTKNVGNVHIFDIGQTKKEYQYYEPFDFCMKPPVEVTLTPVWSWLANSTLKRTGEEFQGKTINVWSFKNTRDDVYSEAGFLAMDDNTPVYYVSSEAGMMLFDDYKDSPPPESKFVIPNACEAATKVPKSLPPPPPPPRLSNSFTSKITLLQTGSEVTFDMFVNYDLKKSLKITKFGSNGVVKSYQLTIGSADKSYQYLNEPFDWCTTDPEGGTVTPMWSWLANSTYKGVYEFMGQQVGLWTYKNKTNGVISEASFLAPDFKTPVYMLNNFDDGVMFFEDYDDSTPPPESKFVIPETCRSTRGLFQ